MSHLTRQYIVSLVGHWPSTGSVLDVHSVRGGLSGASIFRVQCQQGSFALKQWPDAVPDAKILQIHATLRWAAQHGFTKLAVPIVGASGQTLVKDARGHRWELSVWLPGASATEKPVSRARLVEAMNALGQFHSVLSESPRGLWDRPDSPTAIPALKVRALELDKWLHQKWDQLVVAFSRSGPSPSFGINRDQLDIVRRLLSPIALWVHASLDHTCRLQVVAGDLWRNNVVFSDEQVSGFVDFSAMRIDAPVTDVARLLGSLTETRDDWLLGLRTYQGAAPAEAASYLPLADVLHRSGVLLTALNWLWWLYVERRAFSDWPVAQSRCREVMQDLQNLTTLPIGA